MKAAIVIVFLAIFGLGALSTTSCLVDRRSERYTCDDNSTCLDGRVCDHGYCVQRACPSVCTSCDLTDLTCRIECGSGKVCGAVQCPAGFDCTIKCGSANACGEIDCKAAAACDITCTGGASCGAITCGARACKVDCSGGASCGAVNCVDSCPCDVRCNNNACPMTSCPQRSSLFCTKDGTASTPCDSTGTGCDTCL